MHFSLFLHCSFLSRYFSCSFGFSCLFVFFQTSMYMAFYCLFISTKSREVDRIFLFFLFLPFPSFYQDGGIASLTALGGQEFHCPHFSSYFIHSYFFSNFLHFCPHFGPLGGWVDHLGRPWLRYYLKMLNLFHQDMFHCFFWFSMVSSSFQWCAIRMIYSPLFRYLHFQGRSGVVAGYILSYHFSSFIKIFTVSFRIFIFFPHSNDAAIWYFIIDSYQQGQVLVSGYWIFFFSFPYFIKIIFVMLLLHISPHLSVYIWSLIGSLISKDMVKK